MKPYNFIPPPLLFLLLPSLSPPSAWNRDPVSVRNTLWWGGRRSEPMRGVAHGCSLVFTHVWTEVPCDCWPGTSLEKYAFHLAATVLRFKATRVCCLKYQSIFFLYFKYCGWKFIPDIIYRALCILYKKQSLGVIFNSVRGKNTTNWPGEDGACY